MTPPPTSIDGTDITGATIDGQEVQEITVDGNTVFTAGPPASESDQKISHRYFFSSDLSDQVGSSNATDSGTSVVSGNFVDGAARQGDGSSAFVSLGTLSSWVSDINDGGAIAFGTDIASMSSGDAFLGVDVSGEKLILIYDGGGEIRLDIGTPAKFGRAVSSGAGLNDGQTHRVAINVDPQNSGGTIDVDFFVDGASVSIGDRFSGVDDLSGNAQIITHAIEQGGSQSANSTAIIDDVCLFDQKLTQAEASSYNSPY
jgi:hypothetical protein